MTVAELLIVCGTVLVIAALTARLAGQALDHRLQRTRLDDARASRTSDIVTAVEALRGASAGLERVAARVGEAVTPEPQAVDRYVGQRVHIHLRGRDGSLRGVLKEAAPDALVLVRAEYLTSDQTAPVVLDGDQILGRHRVDFFQALSDGSSV